MSIGKAKDLFQRLVATRATEPQFGQHAPEYVPEAGHIWGELVEGGSDKGGKPAGPTTITGATITVRGLVTLSAQDRLRHLGTGATYRIHGIARQGLNTLVITAERLGDL